MLAAPSRSTLPRKRQGPGRRAPPAGGAGHELLGIRSATTLTAETFAQPGKLLTVGCCRIGTSQVDLGAAAHAGIPVFNAPFSNTPLGGSNW